MPAPMRVAPPRIVPCEPLAPARHAPDAASLPSADAVQGGHRPWSLPACGLAIGLMAGGIAGMALNPLGGATAISIGAHLALFVC